MAAILPRRAGFAHSVRSRKLTVIDMSRNLSRKRFHEVSESSMKRRIAWLGAVLLATLSLAAVFQPAYAAAGCRVDYAVTNQWTGGFGASVTIVNLGDPVNGWNLTFTFPASGQAVTQGWNATWTQSGQNVTATNAGWNASLGTNASVGIGF